MSKAAMRREDAEDIIRREVRAFRGLLPGYDREDLQQECRISVARALQKLDGRNRGSKSYIRLTCKNRLTNLLRSAHTQGRCPHDAWGRPQPTAFVSINHMPPLGAGQPLAQALALDPEPRVEARDSVRYLREKLDPRDWEQLVAAFKEGAAASRLDSPLAAVHSRARAILERVGYRVSSEAEEEDDMSSTDEDLPTCHARGDEPAGYDPGEPECHQCPDKFTCLPDAIDAGLVQITLDADREVEAVTEGRLEYMDAIARMKRRLARMKAGASIPAEERADWQGLADEDTAAPAAPAAPAVAAPVPAEPAPPAEPEPEPEPEPDLESEPEPEPEPEGPVVAVLKGRGAKRGVSIAGKRVARVEETSEGWGWFAVDGAESMSWFEDIDAALRDLADHLSDAHGKVVFEQPAKAAKKATKKRAAKPAKAAKKDAPKRPAIEPLPDYWPKMRDKKLYPSPRTLPEEVMQKKLEQAQQKLGCNIQLEYGMQIVRRTRAGEVIAVIRPNGFEYTITDEALIKQARLDGPTQLFGSLSSVAMWGEGRLRTGNDFFNIAKHHCTEIRSADHRIIDRRGGAPGA